MPIVKGKSDLIADLRASKTVPEAARARGRIIVAAGTVAHLATDLATSKYLLAEIPADAILDSRTAFKTDTWMTGANIKIGTETDDDALFTGAKGANVQPVAFGGAHHGLPIWQALGLAARPGTNVVSLWLHAPADATAAGSAKFEIHYRTA